MGTKDWFRNKSASRKNGGGSNNHVMGCITGFFHWFHFHKASLFSTRCDAHAALFAVASSTTESAGVKPPRNSLELDFDHLASEDCDIPFSCIEEVRKARSGGGNIVAKLMGLEYLPNSTNIIENYNLDQLRQPLRARNSNVGEEEDIRRGTKSLPATPARMSIASRRSWDSDLRTSSVQNKENLSVLAMDELKCRFQDYVSSPVPSPALKKIENGCGSGSGSISGPRQYARDIVKQMKERVGRRIEKSRSPIDSLQQSPTSVKKKRETTPFVQKGKSSLKPKSVAKLTPMMECKKVRCERFNERPAVAVSSSSSLRKPRRFIRMNPRTPIIDVRREDIIPLLPHSVPSVHPPPQPEPAELQYVKRVLERAFIQRVGPRSDYPLDPIIFHELELFSIITNNSSSQLRHRCNRKLLFDLIKEIMISESLSKKVKQNIVLDRIWSKIRRSPQSKCETIEDIDALIGSDLRDNEIRQLLNHHAVEEEADLIADDLEKTIIDYLIVEVCCSKLGNQ